jgi:hypothetical protein
MRARDTKILNKWKPAQFRTEHFELFKSDLEKQTSIGNASNFSARKQTSIGMLLTLRTTHVAPQTHTRTKSSSNSFRILRDAPT